MEERLDGMPEEMTVPEIEAEDNAQLLVALLDSGKPALVAGLSLVGEEGFFVRSVGIYQCIDHVDGEFQNIRGWTLIDGHPDEDENCLHWLDTKVNKSGVLVLPNLMVYFIMEVSESMMSEDVDRAVLKKILDFSMEQIHD